MIPLIMTTIYTAFSDQLQQGLSSNPVSFKFLATIYSVLENPIGFSTNTAQD